MARLPDYDPSIIEKAAERLYEKATATILGSVAMGLCLGGIFGAVPLTSLGASWPIPQSFGFATLLAGALVGAAIGYVVGDARAFGYRLQAQATLSQLQLERNTALTAQALQALAAGGARTASRPAPATVPPAVAPPPVSVPPVVAPPDVLTGQTGRA